MQDVHCRVLVIGGGAAPMRAAIAAHDAGATTLLVSKQTPGYSGNSSLRAQATRDPLALQISTIARSSLWPIPCMLDHMNHQPMVWALATEACARIESS